MSKSDFSLEAAIIDDLNRYIASLQKKLRHFRILAHDLNVRGLREEAEEYYEKARRAESLLHYLEGAKKEVKLILKEKEAEG